VGADPPISILSLREPAKECEDQQDSRQNQYEGGDSVFAGLGTPGTQRMNAAPKRLALSNEHRFQGGFNSACIATHGGRLSNTNRTMSKMVNRF
jgi:hypothetical protein